MKRWLWKTRDGTVLRMKEMGDNHLLHTINLLERMGKHAHMSEFMAMNMYSPQGEMAEVCLDNEIRAWEETAWESFMPSIYFDLLIVAKARGILDDDRIWALEVYGKRESRESETDWYQMSPKPVCSE